LRKEKMKRLDESLQNNAEKWNMSSNESPVSFRRRRGFRRDIGKKSSGKRKTAGFATPN